MDRSILIGNGFNSAIGISSLDNQNIINRFCKILYETRFIYENIFKVKISEKIIENMIIKSSDNIEKIAQNLLDYIKRGNIYDHSVNLEKDMMDLIKVSAINAIFIDDTKFIKLESSDEKMYNSLKKYDKLYSLNYSNAWNSNFDYIYLHGEFTFDKSAVLTEGLPVILYDEILYNSFEEYRFCINKYRENSQIHPFKNTRSLIFSPYYYNKQDTVNMGEYPSDNYYPSDHDFPMEAVELYYELNEITQIDVFGVSPFGDNDLINRLKIINNGTIYVYNMEKEQIYEWENKLGLSNYIFKNANEFTNL